MYKNGMRPVHPGEVLREDYLLPLGMSANALANALNVPAPRINDVVRERRGVSADTAMRSPSGRVVIHLARSARPGNWLPTGGAGRLTLVLQVEDPHDAGTPSADETRVQLPEIKRVAC